METPEQVPVSGLPFLDFTGLPFIRKTHAQVSSSSIGVPAFLPFTLQFLSLLGYTLDLSLNLCIVRANSPSGSPLHIGTYSFS